MKKVDDFYEVKLLQNNYSKWSQIFTLIAQGKIDSALKNIE
jgi:hypothetical protein